MSLKVLEREKRVRDRSRRRISVRYGPEGARHLGYTSDLGESGLFLQGNTLYPPGSVLHLSLDLQGGTWVVHGVVRWVKEVPQAFRKTLRGGMGIELVPE
jgi:hypothetical protein